MDLWLWHSPPRAHPSSPRCCPGLLALSSSSCLSKVPPPPPSPFQPGSQDPQLNCSRPAGSKGSWASDAIIRAIQSFNDCRGLLEKASLSIPPLLSLSLFFFISVVIFTDQSFFICLALIFVFPPPPLLLPSPPHPHALNLCCRRRCYLEVLRDEWS